MLYTYILGILLCVGSGYSSLYDSHTDVVNLTPQNFDSLVSNGDEVWIVEFYAPWCGHCKNLVPEYKKAAKVLKGIAKVGALDAEKFQSFAHDFGVSGFPTIKIFTGKKHVPYKGSRTAEGFVEAALKATKTKAYEALGKKADDYTSEKPSKPERFGHDIPWKKVLQNTSQTSAPQQNDEQQTKSQETSEPNTSLTNSIQLQPTTKKNGTKRILLRAKKIAQTTTATTTEQPTTTTTEQPTTTTTQQPTTLSILNKFKLLQAQLFRGNITDESKPKIVRALIKLKAVLQGRQVDIKSIIRRRSDQRRKHKV